MANGNEETADVPSWFKETFEAIGSSFVADPTGKEVAAETPWGAGYIPKRMADMNSTQREQANGMLKRYNDDPDYGETDAPNGTKVITHLPSGVAINSDNFLLTADAEGKFEVASMFDIGMMTGELTRGKAEMDAQRAVLNYKPSTGEAETPMADPMAPATSEETATGKAMLEVDQSGATPPTEQVPGAPIAGEVTPGAMPTTPETVSFGDNSYTPAEYDTAGLTDYVIKNAPSVIAKGLTKMGLKEGTPEYEKAMNEQMPKFANWAAESKFKKAPPPANATDNPAAAKAQTEAQMAEPKAAAGTPSHWDDTKPDSGLKRAYDNSEYGNNYGNYESREQYYDTLDKTYTTLQTVGKMTASDDKLLTDLKDNEKKYYDLGIATTGDLRRYKADMKNADTKRNNMSSAAARRDEKKAQKQQFLDEAATKVDERMDAGENVLDITDHFTPSLARKINSKRPEQTNQQKQRYTAMIDTADNVNRIQKHLKKADMEALETLSPIERGKAFISKYNGDMTEGQLSALFANQSMNELVSKTVKQISGAAASDQERAYIKSWMLGEDGVSGEVVQAIMDRVQRDAYNKASRYGQELYDNSDLGRLRNLSKAVEGLKNIEPNEKLIAESMKNYKGPAKEKIKRVPGTRRN